MKKKYHIPTNTTYLIISLHSNKHSIYCSWACDCFIIKKNSFLNNLIYYKFLFPTLSKKLYLILMEKNNYFHNLLNNNNLDLTFNKTL